MLLSDKLEKYKGHRKGALIKLISPKYIFPNDIDKIIHENINKDMDNKMYSYMTSSMPDSYIHNAVSDPDKMFCSELVAYTYQKLGIMKKENIPSYYNPKDFLTKNIPIEDNMKLDDAVYFRF